ncbi:CHAD domain-containing protein [soil metagenome]
MAYQLARDESVSEGVRRIAHELVSEAVGLLDAPGGKVEQSVHQVRKNCKMLRGLVRLVRPGMGETYRTANVTFRDAARELAPIRDAHALLATFDDLVASADSEIVGDGVGAVRAELADRAAAASRQVTDDDERIMRVRELLVAGGQQIPRWPLDEDANIIAGGVARSYKRGRRGWRETMLAPSDHTLHQWRKRVKYTWYHLRLLCNAAPSMLKSLIGRFHDLSDVLGDDHDLAVLTTQLRADPGAFGGDDQTHRAQQLITTCRGDLQVRARSLGSRLYVETPSAFSQRVTSYVTTWREQGDELVAGQIADLATPGDDLDEWSVRQLYTLARRLDVAGRSTMDRDALIASIRAAGWTQA